MADVRTPVTTEAPATRPRDHQNSIDGLRGFAYLWVVAGHFWIIVPHDVMRDVPVLGWVTSVGNRGVSIFLVLGGFFAARSLITYQERGHALRPSLMWLLRRVLRVTLAIVPLMFVIVGLSFWEKPNPYANQDVAGSVVSIVTHSWPWFVREHVYTAVSELGHLWYISVYVHGVIALCALFLVARGRRVVIIPVLVAALAYVTYVRSIALEQHDELWALSSTETRIDGMLWGALLAFAIPRLRRVDRWIDVVGAAALIAVLVLAGYATLENYFQWPGVVNNVVICLLVAGTWLSRGPLMTRIFANRVATEIGRRSLTIYVWHFPLFWLISRHTAHWSYTERALVAIAALIALVEFVHRQWDEPMREWINRRFPSRPRS